MAIVTSLSWSWAGKWCSTFQYCLGDSALSSSAFKVSLLFVTVGASTQVYSRTVEPFLSCIKTPAMSEVLLGARLGTRACSTSVRQKSWPGRQEFSQQKRDKQLLWRTQATRRLPCVWFLILSPEKWMATEAVRVRMLETWESCTLWDDRVLILWAFNWKKPWRSSTQEGKKEQPRKKGKEKKQQVYCWQQQVLQIFMRW